MFTPALTAYEALFTASPPPSLSLPAIAPTTLVQALRRDDSPEVLTNAQTCGYTSGAWSSAVTCGPQQSCTYYSSPYSAPNFGCCSNGSGCGYVSTCLDYRAQGNFNTYGGVAIAQESFLCGSVLPYCSTLLLYGSTYAPGSTQSFYYYSCQAQSAPAVIAFQTTFNARDETSTSTATSTTPSATTTTTTQESSTSTSTISSSASSSVSNVQNSSASSPQSTQASSNALPSTKANIVSTSPNSASSTIAEQSTTSGRDTPSNSLSQTSQIGVAVGVSIGVCILLASIAFFFFRRRKAKADRRWLDQPSQTFPTYLHHVDGTKAVHPFDYKSDSFRTHLSGKSIHEGEAPYELSSTGRTHELSAGNN